MELANANLAKTIRWGIDRLFTEDKSLCKRRLEARLRSHVPDPQTVLTKGRKKSGAEEEDLDGPAK